MPLITIIIPVFKAEVCLSRCIESIISQTYNNWELLLIDDGSPDKSGKICDEYSKKDSRIKVFHINNGGPSLARNFGLKEGKGDYVCFVDSDDWVESTYLENLYNGVQNEGVGVVVGGHIRERGENLSRKSVGDYHYDAHNMNKMFEDRMISHWGYTVAKLYNYNIIRSNDISFPRVMRFSEDLALFLNYLRFVDWVKFIPETDYHYIVPEGHGSLIASYNSFESEYEGYQICNKFFHELASLTKSSDDDMKSSYEWMAYMLSRAINTIYRPGKNYKNHSERMKILRGIPVKEYTYSHKYSAQCLFVNRWALFLLSNKMFLFTDILLNTFFHLRYLKK